MKKSIFFFITFFSISSFGYTQNFSLNLGKVSLNESFDRIKKEGKVTLFYSDDELDVAKLVRVKFVNKSALEMVSDLVGPNFEAKLMDKSVIVIVPVTKETSIKKELVDISITGKVRNELGEAMSSVSVRLKGSAKGISTDLDGSFSINVPEVGGVLIISYVGYVTQEIKITKATDLDIILEQETSKLDDVAVVGYGKQKKESVVGAQATILAKDLRSPTGNLTAAIAGRIAGVVATQRGGGPGADGAALFIRGIGTFASSPQAPLLVVDGVPDRDINNIDPEDIESFTVLKDATATAVYGTRGANGVILINTKSGKIGKPTINAEYNHGITKFTELPEFVDGPSFMRLYNEGLQMRGRTPFYSEDIIGKHESGIDPDLYPNVDWYDVLFNDVANNDRVTLNVNGGSESATYYLSAGYYGETGLFKTENIDSYNSQLKLNRFNFTSNLNLKITQKTKLDFGLNGYITDYNRPAYGVNEIFALATATAPHTIPAQYSNGQWPQIKGTLQSPYMALTQSGVTNQASNTIRSNLRLTQDLDVLLDGLSATAMFAYDINNNSNLTRSRTLQTYFATGRDAEGNLITEISSPGSDQLGFGLTRFGDKRLYVETAVNYAQKFGEHDVSGLLLFNQSDYRDASSRVDTYKAAIPYRQRNFVGRGTYGYAGKYFAEANFSYSGSDNFVESERYGFFPSFGAGWIVSRENFFEPLADIVSLFKLRYSYGLSGNAAVSNPNLRFLYLTTIGDNGGYTFGAPGSQQSFTGYNESRIGGDVRWETSYRQNLGVELKFLNNDLGLTVELFQEKREGILLPNYVIPYVSGFTIGNIPYNNVGKTNNKGIDITLDYNKNWNKTNFFSFKGTFNYNKNKAVFDGLPEWRYPYLNRIGQAISQRFGYISQGFFESEEQIQNSAKQAGDVRPGDLRYKDLNGDGIINSNDQTAIGYGSVPRIVYGLNFGGGYKGFDISLFFQGTGLVDFNYAGGFGTTPFSQGASYGNMYTTINDRWTPENPNPNAFYPRLSTNQDQTTNYYTSTHWIKRADYIRLKQAELGYTFNENSFLDRYAIQKLRVFMSGTNLFTLSPWKYWDPELGDGRGAAYPNISVYNVGVRFNFQ